MCAAERFSCHICDSRTELLSDIVNHCINSHFKQEIKYRELILNDETGRYGYKTKYLHNVIPEKIVSSGKSITVIDDTVYVKETLNHKLVLTPVKQLADGKCSLSKNTQSNTDTDFEEAHTLKAAMDEMKTLILEVLESLSESALLPSYLKFNRLLSENKIPLDNICFLLFLDIVDWFSCTTTTQMRYREQTVRFWQIGYRLFHGKFLRFMSGLRSYGQILDNKTEKGDFDPKDSRINFAIPAKNNLYPGENRRRVYYPGDSLEMLSKTMGTVPLKLCVDGKKISRGKGKVMGDIDCWGHEGSPTLSEKREEWKKDQDEIAHFQLKLDSIMENGMNTLQDISEECKRELCNNLKHRVQRQADINKLLRERASLLEKLETKFKTMGGKDWMSSKFYPVICSVRVDRSAIKHQLEESLSLTNKIAFYGATLNGEQSLYCKEDSIVLPEQENYYSLNENFESDDTRHWQQRTQKWFELRGKALVTGSTCHKAFGLGKLKEQQEHYDQVVLGKHREAIPDNNRKNMEYGSKHEIDAVATVTCRVVPFLYPSLKFYEEGCIQLEYKHNTQFMVVSPDGRLRESTVEAVKMMYENKCKAPDSYSPTAYYIISHYYVAQLLSEMNAYNCDSLLFTCWSEQSMTVFYVKNDKELWSRCWNELVKVYAEEKRIRPKHFTEASKLLKRDIKVFRENNTTLIGEFPISRAVGLNSKRNSEPTSVYIAPEKKPTKNKTLT